MRRFNATYNASVQMSGSKVNFGYNCNKKAMSINSLCQSIDSRFSKALNLGKEGKRTNLNGLRRNRFR